jgi:hypothetical protein
MSYTIGISDEPKESNFRDTYVTLGTFENYVVILESL